MATQGLWKTKISKHSQNLISMILNKSQPFKMSVTSTTRPLNNNNTEQWWLDYCTH